MKRDEDKRQGRYIGRIIDKQWLKKCSSNQGSQGYGDNYKSNNKGQGGTRHNHPNGGRLNDRINSG